MPVKYAIDPARVTKFSLRSGVVGGTPTDASAVMAGNRLLSSAMRSSDDNDWPVHSLVWCCLSMISKTNLYKCIVFNYVSVYYSIVKCRIYG